MFLKQIDDLWLFRNEKTEEMRELTWRINYSEEAIGEQMVEGDPPGSWKEVQENTILSKWNKVEFISNRFF